MKKLFLFMLVLFIAGLAFADTVVVGTGTQVSRFPLGSFYGYERSAALYTDTELGTQNTRISEIAWYTNTATSVSVPTKIYLKTTTGTTLTNSTWATMIAGATLVYDATHTGTVAGGWNNFVLSNTFDVDDGFGLIILVERNYGGGGNGTYSGAGVNATSYTGGHFTWQQDNSAPIGNGSASSIRPNVTITFTTYTVSGPPNNAAISSPADGATGVLLTATLNWVSGGGAPTGYKLSFGTDNPPTNIVNNVDMGNVTTYDPNPDMAYSTTYYWKVVAYNGNGDAVGTPVWSFTTMADPTQPLPYTQDFNSGTSLAAINWTGDMLINANHGTNGSNGLCRNLYSYATTCNAVTPPIGPMTNNCQILFDYRIVNYSGYPGTGTTLGANDKIEVQVSNGGSYSTIYTIDQNNHATTNAFAGVTIPVTAYAGNIINVKFLCTWGAGDYYVDIDNVVVRETPQSGLLTVNPNPVNCGTYYVGFQKTVQVSLTNTGVAAFDVTSIALADYTDFQLANLPALPVTINPGAPAVTFDVVFAPTMAGALTTNLLINDTRQNSSIVVSGTGVQALVGEICENPYLATLPLVDYAGTTAGYNNDYTEAMFTGLNTPGYVRGKDWVAKVSIPEDGWLDISLTDQVGYSSQRMGVFLVNTIPSIANPATVLAKATASSGLMSIDDAVVTAGDYYVIVDNYPPPSDVYFVLNISFEPAPTGPVAAPNLDYPADRQNDLPKTGFPFQFSWNLAGAEPERYDLWIAKVSDLTITPYDPDEFFSVAVEFPNVTSPYQPAFTYDYSEVYVWTVLGSRGTDPVQFQWPPYEFTIQSDPTITLPHTQDFGTDSTPVWPNGWTQTYSGGVTSDRWNVSASTNAGGTANEMECSWYDATGISRLITPPINTNSIPLFTASFNQYYNDFGAGVTAKLQYSHDLNTWYDTDYAIISGSGSIGSYETVTISGLNAPVTYLAWVMDGNHYQFNYWYVDDVYLAVPYNLDAKAVSIEMCQVVEPVAFTPMATVGNNGLQTISFSVTMTIGGTTLPAQSVTALAPGATQQLSFGSFTPVANTFYDVTVTTNLAGDQDPANDTIAGSFVCLELNKTAYGDVCYDPGNILDGPATFSLRDPGTITDLPAANPWPGHFLAGADWIDGGWWGVEYYDEDNLAGGNWWQIDTTTGAGTDNGDVGLYLRGVAWDPVADVLYGVNANSLHTLNKLTGAPTLIGQLTWNGEAFNGRLVDIAWNNNNSTLYGLDIGYDAVFTIDPVTLAVTPLGYTAGYDLEYAQGMAFDQDTGFLYLAASTDNDGFLLWVNTNQPDAEGYMGETYYIGRLQRGCEVDGFVIPYPQLAIPDLTIALESGMPTLSWNSIVGASAYKVYGSNDPYAADPWTLVATTASTTYAYVGTEPYHFFKVTAVDSPAPVRTQFTGLERVRQVFQPTRVQYNRDIQPQATGTRASRTKPVK